MFGGRITLSLLGAVILTCCGSSLLCGYNIAVLNLPGEFVKDFLAGEKSTEEVRSFYYSIASAVYVVGGAFGAFSSGVVADRAGRRGGLLINNAFAILAGILGGICQVTQQPVLLYLSRVLIGFNNGMTFGLASMYLTEISPISIRGAVGACHQLAITFGILLGNIMTLNEVLNTKELWPLACALTGVPALIQLFLFWFFPESPRYLLIKKGLEEEACQAHQRFDQLTPVSTFLQGIRDEMAEADRAPAFQFMDIFTKSIYRKAMLIACTIQIMQQLSGINAVMAYSKLMLESAGVASQTQPYYVCLISAINFITTIISLPLLERFGRRFLLLWPTALLMISLIILCISTNLAMSYPSVSTSSGVVAVIFINVYVIGFALGLGVVPALIVSEIFLQGPRAAAYSVSQSVQWISNLMVMFAYPNLERIIHGYIFLVFLVIVAAIWALLFLIVPETKGCTVNEVNQILNSSLTVFSKKRSLDTSMTEMSGITSNTTLEPANPKSVFKSADTVNTMA